MIHGIGTDIVSVERFRRASQRWGLRILNRLFSFRERTRCDSFVDPVPHYAARFAAKEAVAKALGTGLRHGIRFCDIEIVVDPQGKPAVVLHAAARETLKLKGVGAIHLSLSHADEMCVATALAESE